MGLQVRESAKRIIELCRDKQLAKTEREEARKLRGKIVGAGNTMDSYGEKFMSVPYEKSGKSYLESNISSRIGYQKANTMEQAWTADKVYDKYESGASLTDKLGGIINRLDQLQEQEHKYEKFENSIDESQKNNDKKVADDFDLLEFAPEEKTALRKD